jgi:flagellar L-ring protein precursor FlgH
MNGHRTVVLALCLGVLATGFVAVAGAVAAPADSLTVVRHRASWLGDGVELREGDLVTVLLDERTMARESSSELGSNKRSLGAGLGVVTDGTAALGTTGIDSNWDSQSRQEGQAKRSGDLSGVLTARVLSVDAFGLARIQGTKTMTVDGRKQEITLGGIVRPQDLSSDHVVHSSRVADATITYTGKKIAPKMGILGKVVSMLWPF